jgi:hypothetical protein
MAPLSHDLNDEQPVCISIKGDTLTVSPDPVPISIMAKHRAHWFLSGEGTIESITFASGNGPFKAAHNVPKSKRHVLSDVVTNPDHLKTKLFKYTVVVSPSGGKPITLDPDVHVMP